MARKKKSQIVRTENVTTEQLEKMNKAQLLDLVYALSIDRIIPADVMFIWNDVKEMTKGEIVMLIEDMQEFEPQPDDYAASLQKAVDAYKKVLGTFPHHDGIELNALEILEAIENFQECVYGDDTVVIEGRTLYTIVSKQPDNNTGHVVYKEESVELQYNEAFGVWTHADEQYEGTQGLAVAALKKQAAKARKSQEAPEKNSSERKARSGRRFSEDDIRQMRQMRNVDNVSLTKIAQQFGCSPVFVRNIALYKLYQDVSDDPSAEVESSEE